MTCQTLCQDGGDPAEGVKHVVVGDMVAGYRRSQWMETTRREGRTDRMIWPHQKGRRRTVEHTVELVKEQGCYIRPNSHCVETQGPGDCAIFCNV